MTKRYGLLIDLERCTGCRTCTVACKVEHGIEVGSGIRVETVGGAHPDTPAGKYPNLTMHYEPIPCMHCAQPPCRAACSGGAIHQRDDGVVLIDEGKCNGCKECLAACPYGALFYDDDRKVVRKCDLCCERVDEGFEPFCALCCPEGAIYFGDLKDWESAVSRLVSQKGVYTLKPERKTGPSVHYSPPMARRKV